MSYLHISQCTTVAHISAGLITAFALGSIFARQSRRPKVIPGPRVALPPVPTSSEEKHLEFPLDALPGGRDVSTPYGSIRVYEWGPEDGRKVLFVHGIATPCIGLGGIAHSLVEKGCRVMLFDLWGRGYSDSSGDLNYDERLYLTQIFFVLASSSLSWTGASSGGFSLIGYSLGGGISAVVNNHFPELIDSVVLLAPAGLIRRKIVNSLARFLYSTGWISDNFMVWLVTLMRPGVKKGKHGKGSATSYTGVEGEVTAGRKLTPLSKSRPEVTGNMAVAWQVNNNSGFPHSFVSSLLYGPVHDQGMTWARLGLRKDKTLIIAGRTDPSIVLSELKEDAIFYIGNDKVEFREVKGAHDFPIAEGSLIASLIGEFWGL